MASDVVSGRAGALTGDIGLHWRGTRTQIAKQVLFLVGMGALSALLKKLSPGIGVPGSSAVLWLGPIVAARIFVRHDGAATSAGILTAVFGLGIGINNGFGYNLILYGVAGLATDGAARIPFIDIRSLAGAAATGIFAHLVKFGIIVGNALTSPITRNFVVLGLTKSFLLHVAFGAAAGITAWLVYKARDSSQNRKKQTA